MPKSGSIGLLFERQDDGSFSRKAMLLQNILEYVVQLRPGLDDVPFFATLHEMYTFKDTQLMNWLIDHNSELRGRFEGKGFSPAYKVTSVRHLIKGRISDLMDLLIVMEAGTTTAEKTREEIPLYAFSPSGILLAYLVDNIRRDKIEHVDTIYKLILSFTWGETARQVFLQTFFKKSMEKGIFSAFVENFIRKVRTSEIEFKSHPPDAMMLFLRLISTDYSGKQIDANTAALWLETLNELDDGYRRLFLYGAKQHLEVIEAWFDTKKETEIQRQQHASNYVEIVIEILCKQCHKTSPITVGIPDIVRNQTITKQCPKCNDSNSLVIPVDRLKSELIF